MAQVVVTSEVGVHAQACRHHWLIETPSGPVSQGRCRRCHQVRQFENHIENSPKEEESSQGRVAGQRALSAEDESPDNEGS